MVKFAHLADCHVGGWREPVLRELNHQAFVTAIDNCISERVDFVIIAGDLFHTAFPAVESLALVTRKLKQLKDCGIPVYAIPGSHDFSPSGACMLDVLEEAGLLIHVCRGNLVDGKLRLSFVTDPRTGVKLTGLIGKKGALDKEYYELLDREFLERESGYKIFVFHCSIVELKPKELQDMDAMPASLLPAGFSYYAGGHVHVVDNKSLDSRQNIVFPGPTFPNNFAELEKLKQGSFCIVDRWNVRVVPVQVAPVVCVKINASSKTPSEVEQELLAELRNVQDSSCVLLIRLFGVLREGSPSDIHWERVLEACLARAVLRNTNALLSKEFEDTVIAQQPIESMEKTLIAQQTSKITLLNKESDAVLVEQLMQAFDIARQDGEKVSDAEAKIIESAENVFQECLKTAKSLESPSLIKATSLTPNMWETTTCLLVRENQICLPMKKRGFGIGRLTGYGGKKDETDKSIDDAALRELQEESGITASISDLKKVARFEYHFPEGTTGNQVMTAYILTKWQGAPKETEEMKPVWCAISDIPFDKMWDSDRHWIPEILRGKILKGDFYYNDQRKIVSKDLQEVSEL